MVVLSFIAALLFVALLCIVINKYGVPDMVSSIYYLMGKKGWVFQTVMILFGMLMMVCLLDCGKGVQCLAFLACGGLMFVGAVPRFLDENERKVHKTGAIVSAVASVGWCLTVDWRIVVALSGWYGVYWVCRDDESRPWFMAEVTAIWMVLLTYWSTVG
uniref:Uncharacterized protein n=1 Tax=Siphoviridae sp. ctA4S13 TaxID=2826179 RepID=A0A8S5MRG4_9CAUD|nr:MAG TPA: hypothetical protein [Siphoviridae sp. ctA4S13]DAG37753.1 MAG TPA: hypothetical protein [Caudoviricetes sp.]